MKPDGSMFNNKALDAAHFARERRRRLSNRQPRQTALSLLLITVTSTLAVIAVLHLIERLVLPQ